MKREIRRLAQKIGAWKVEALSGFLNWLKGCFPTGIDYRGGSRAVSLYKRQEQFCSYKVLRSCQHNCYTFSLFFDFFTTQKPRVGRILAIDVNGAPPGLAMEPVW